MAIELTFKLKQCTRCGIEKPASPEFFHRHSKSKLDGLYPQCKVCKNAYAQTEKGKEVIKVRTKSQRAKRIEQYRAMYAVNRAVKTGKLPRVSTLDCVMCGKKAREYHHGSYARAHRLDVIPLCRPCHVAEHRIEKQALKLIARLPKAA